MSCAGAIDFVTAGRHGWLRRHGLHLVPRAAAPFIRVGLITIPEARTGIVFAAIAEDPERWLKELARILSLHHTSVRRVTDLLERDCYLVRAGRGFAIVKMPAPDWRAYLRQAA